MKLISIVLFAVAVYGTSSAQTKASGGAKTAGHCSPAVTGDNNTITFTYCGSDPEETKKVRKLLEAIAKGEDVTNSKLDEILEILLKPITLKKSASLSVPVPLGQHPRAAIAFSTEDPVDRGQFEVLCDQACTPVEVCRLMGQNSTILASVSDQPRVAEFLFQRQFPALTQCTLTVESRDYLPVRILDVITSRRIANLVTVAIRSSMVTAGSVMQ
jgi:hypothetical protein